MSLNPECPACDGGGCDICGGLDVLPESFRAFLIGVRLAMRPHLEKLRAILEDPEDQRR